MKYMIALVCENGASTGMVVKRMQKAAEEAGVEAEIKAFPFTQMENFVEAYDAILFGPQLAFKKDTAIEMFPNQSQKIAVIPTMDFGMMNGKKILEDAIQMITT